MTEQEKLIGIHPDTSHILGEWLTYEDQPSSVFKKHRKLEENNCLRRKAIESIADWILEHHIILQKTDALKRKAEILKKYEFDKYVDSLKLLPTEDNTLKGNFAEIILVEYLKKSTDFSPIIYKLRYNTNVDQSMKGDDVLLFDPKDIFEKVIYGESKYRSTPSKKAIKDAITNLEGNKKLPISIGFVADRLYENKQRDLADKMLDLQAILNSGKIDVHNVGFLLSTKSSIPSKDTFNQVEKHLITTNQNLVFISLGLENPLEIVQESFELARTRLLNIKQDGTI